MNFDRAIRPQPSVEDMAAARAADVREASRNAEEVAKKTGLEKKWKKIESGARELTPEEMEAAGLQNVGEAIKKTEKEFNPEDLQ